MMSKQESGPQLAQRVLGQTGYRPPLLESEIKLRLDRNEGRGGLEHLGAAELLGELGERGTELARRYPQTAGLQAELAERFGDRKSVV